MVGGHTYGYPQKVCPQTAVYRVNTGGIEKVIAKPSLKKTRVYGVIFRTPF